MPAPSLSVDTKQNDTLLRVQGSWRLQHVSGLKEALDQAHVQAVHQLIIEGSKLDELDTAGALLLVQTHKKLAPNKPIQLQNFSEAHEKILRLVEKSSEKESPRPEKQNLNFVQSVGSASIELAGLVQKTVAFLGETILNLALAVKNPRIFRVKELFSQLELVFVHAIPIVALVTFLIGVVIAYLLASQIQKYGGNIFIVDGVSIAMCRELSPIIVAVVMAGRSGSAFTAQIGSMKLNEEVDAIVTLGLSPQQVLVIPRVLALMIAMPLLVFIGDIVGILGGVVIANVQLGITFPTFIDRLQKVLAIKNLHVGLVKAPVFAVFIGLIGCRMGLAVEGNARNLGIHTTSTVVQSIVWVILLNAAFAVICVELGI